jgi:hypothetical protein
VDARIEALGGERANSPGPFLGAEVQGNRAAYEALRAADIRVHEPGESDGSLADHPGHACLRKQGHRPVAAQDPGQGDQVVPGVNVDQRGLMPGVAQDCGLSLRNGISTIRDRLVILAPWAARLGHASELLHRRAEGLGFLAENPIRDNHQFGQREAARRPYGHSPIIGHGLSGRTSRPQPLATPPRSAETPGTSSPCRYSRSADLPGYVLEFDQGGFRTDIGDMHFRVVGELFGAVSRLIGADGAFWLT